MGGGVGLTWHSPVRIATDNSMYAMPETAIGFFTDVGGSYFLPRVKNGDFSLGLYLGLTGQRIIGRDLVKYGIATHFIKQENLDHLHEVLLKNVTKDSTTEEIEDIVQDHSDATAAVGEIKYHDEIRQIFQNDSIQACMDRLEQSNSEFASMTKKMLAPMSPLSLAVVFEQIKRGSKMSIKEVFEMEFKIAAGFCQHTEFFEGVRALLVDKDKQPKWRFKTVH
jgi:3-hydroxyisobutyryl-CoA hydrolase